MNSREAGQARVDIEQIIELSRSGKTLIEKLHPAEGILEVHQHNRFRWIYTGSNSILSLQDPEHPEKLQLPNQIAMMTALLWNDQPKQLLVLGAGCGAFERFINFHLPGVEFASLDADASLIKLAHRYFSMPEDWKVIHQQAEAYLATCERQYDVLFCDLFTGEFHAPCVYDEEFYRHATDCLTKGGALTINLLPSSETDLINLLLPLRRYFPSVMIFDVPHSGNVVILASQDPTPSENKLQERAAALQDRLKLNLLDNLNKFIKLPPITGDA